MKIVDLEEAKECLPQLVEAAVKGETCVIAQDGKPRVKVVACENGAAKRTGFLKGQVDVPPDFDEMCAKDIQGKFEGQGG